MSGRRRPLKRKRWRWDGLWRRGVGTFDDPNNGRLIFRATGINAYLYCRRSDSRTAAVRSLYWQLIRRYKSELCQHCGRRVPVVFHAPDEIWELATGHARYPSGESAPGVLCPQCVDELVEPKIDGYLTWTCSVAWLVTTPVEDRLWAALQAVNDGIADCEATLPQAEAERGSRDYVLERMHGHLLDIKAALSDSLLKAGVVPNHSPAATREAHGGDGEVDARTTPRGSEAFELTRRPGFRAPTTRGSAASEDVSSRTPKSGGRLLDGREWNEMPATRPGTAEATTHREGK